MSQRTMMQRERERETSLASVQEVLSSSGQPLDADTQNFMGARFGHDFGQVRVHTDEKAAESTQSVNALAYTVRQDVVFGQGQYAPSTSEGKKLLAHELTHVVQQAPESTGSAPVARNLSLSESSDRPEMEANEIASHIVDQTSNGLTKTSTISVQSNPGNATLHRFQAGDTGHGGIEEQALTQVGFTSDEASKVYFGNWLRDLSQVPPSILWLINIIALGEFGREITKEDLGTYVPSEHLDNPEGGETYEDPLQKDPDKRKQVRDVMSSAQKSAYRDEQKHSRKIENATRESGLPEYIEVGKFHAKRKLVEAITLGRTPEGMQAMGNGLHAVEDYFSHSNFVEVAIWNLFDKGELTYEQYNDLTYTPLRNDAATIGGKDLIDPRQPAVITGTYASANEIVSKLELLKTEIQHGQLTNAFIKGCFIKYGNASVDISQKPLGTVGGWVGGAIDAVGGGMLVHMTGAFEGWREHSGLSAVGHAFTGLFSSVASLDAFALAETTRAGQQAREEDLGPSHSELAKDAPDHHLFTIAVKLAEYVDQDIGDKMIAAWKTRGSDDKTPLSEPISLETEKAVTDLVDKYVSHPSRDNWWHDQLILLLKK